MHYLLSQSCTRLCKWLSSGTKQTVREAKQHSTGVYPQPSFPPLLFCWLSDAALMRAVTLAGMSALSDTFPLLPAPEVVESHERVSCGASAYSMGKYLPLSYSSTFAACHESFNSCIFSLSSVEFPQYSPTHWHCIVGINPVSCALKFSWVMGRTRWLVSFPTLSYLHAHWSLLFCCLEWAVTPLVILWRALKPEILPLAPNPSSEMTDTGLAAQFSQQELGELHVIRIQSSFTKLFPKNNKPFSYCLCLLAC